MRLLVEQNVDKSVYTYEPLRNLLGETNIYPTVDAFGYVIFGYGRSSTVSRESAGATIRALRESRDWSLADFAAATGVSIMGLSYLERGARKPHKSTVQKVENALGLPPGTYARLVVAADPEAELARLTAAEQPPAVPARQAAAIVVERHDSTEVLEGHAEAQLETLSWLIDRLPTKTSDEYETYILSVIELCVKFEMLAARSWRAAVHAGADSAARLMDHLQALEATRSSLLKRIPESLSARFDRACARSVLPEAVIAALVGVSCDEMWEIRNRGVIPPGALPRIRAFADAVNGGDGESDPVERQADE